MSNKNLLYMCFGIIGMGILFCESCAYIGRVNEERRQEYRRSCEERVRNIRNGPVIGQASLTTSDDLEIPSTLRVIKTARDGKHHYSIVIEGPREELAKFMAQFYRVN